jgi:hypothetical protein
MPITPVSSTRHVFPLSNVRGAPDSPPVGPELPPSDAIGRVDFSLLPEMFDPLCLHPKTDHRYINALGQQDFDDRFAWPPPPQSKFSEVLDYNYLQSVNTLFPKLESRRFILKEVPLRLDQP